MSSKVITDYTRTLLNHKNLILEGPPGTGKTFAIKAICDKIIDDGGVLGGNGRGQFASTLHPITSYEDFVEGLRPSSTISDEKTTPPVMVHLHSNFPDIAIKCTPDEPSATVKYEVSGKGAAQFKLTKIKTDNTFEQASSLQDGLKMYFLCSGGTGSNRNKISILKPLHPRTSVHDKSDNTPSIKHCRKFTYVNRDTLRDPDNVKIVDGYANPYRLAATGSGNWELSLSGEALNRYHEGENGKRWWLFSIHSSRGGVYTIDVLDKETTEKYYVKAYDENHGQRDAKKHPTGAEPWRQGVMYRTTKASRSRFWVVESSQGGLSTIEIEEDEHLSIVDADDCLYVTQDTPPAKIDLMKAEAGATSIKSLHLDEYNLSEPDAEGVQFSVRNGFFLKCCKIAMMKPEEKFVILLDEINRCNVPKVLGDLLTTIEASKRLPWDSENKAWDYTKAGIVSLPYSGRYFSVPENILVVGTMNTTDRSVAPIDAALRRRFAFMRVPPMNKNDLKNVLEKQYGTSVSDKASDAIDAWHDLNKHLKKTLGSDAVLGHSYFFDLVSLIKGDSESSQELISDMWKMSLLPQLADLLDSTGDAGELYNKYIGKEEKAPWEKFGWKLDFGKNIQSNTFLRTTVIENILPDPPAQVTQETTAAAEEAAAAAAAAEEAAAAEAAPEN
jgi:hypothetical protein